MFCPQCGKEYQGQVNFCCQCGSRMTGPSMPDKKLQRSRSDRKIAGVCGGFADYLDWDPTLVRIVWLLLTFFVGWGIITYIICWIVMPEEPAPEKQKAAVAPANAEPAANPST